MQYNFDEIIDRSQNYAAKFEEAYRHYGTNDVIPLWIADMDFRTAQPIIDAIQTRAEQGIFGYTSRPDAYFASVASWQSRRNGYHFEVGRMAFAPGVVPAMRIFLNLFVPPGAKILIQQPVYHPFADIVENTGRKLLVNELIREQNGEYSVDFEDFERKAKGAAAFLLCNPHNPIGKVWPRETLARMGEICLKYGVEILSDEIHSDLILRGKHTVMAGVSEPIAAITTTFTAPSKTFNLAGLQAATVIFNTEERRRRFTEELARMDIARNNCFSLVAVMAALNEGEEWLEQLLTYLRGNVEMVRAFCARHIPMLKPNCPEATYLIWVDARELGMAGQDLSRFMVERAGVAFGKGSDFGKGGEGFLRLNAACPRSVLEKALVRVKDALDAR